MTSNLSDSIQPLRRSPRLAEKVSNAMQGVLQSVHHAANTVPYVLFPSLYPSKTKIRQWFRGYPGDSTVVRDKIEYYMNLIQILHDHNERPSIRVETVTQLYEYLLHQPAFITAYSQFRTTTLQKIPVFVETLYTPEFVDVPEHVKDRMRSAFSRYIALINHIQSVILRDH